ncbi:heterokaryon incompatibility protein-domain-containing protein [Bipolaris maydis]|nr:heterokaryon incompatibility protein-domain-containing protein [Bipolaris maydis]
MRLLRRSDTGDIVLTQFSDKDIPHYAILSHTWGPDADEVTFGDLVNGTGRDKPGYKKILFCGEQAAQDGLEYFWIDTCCIDKSSSAELTEAINSMFKWYRASDVCYAFLSDLNPIRESLRDCKWFQRGWTLQELIAPFIVRFYDEEWNFRGDKISLLGELISITQVDAEVLVNTVALEEVPVAVRMSWAAKRETKREEDRAYSLLGILQINMPMLYGEGENAFIRLQKEIIRNSPDMSVFGWTRTTSIVHVEQHSGLLASSPADFEHARSLVVAQDTVFDNCEFSITNRGLKFELPLATDRNTGCYILPINHRHRYNIEGYCLGVFLRQVGPNLYVRAFPNLLESIRRQESIQSLQVAATLSAEEVTAIREQVLHVTKPLYMGHPDIGLSEIEPIGCYDPIRRMLAQLWDSDYTANLKAVLTPEI